MHTCCKQVKDFLDYGRGLHGEIQAFYDSLNEHTDKERLKMLLGYLSRHEQHMEESLHRFEQVTRKEILDVWLSHAPRVSIQDMVGQCGVAERMGLDDVVDMALKFDAAMIKLYRDVAEHANDAQVKGVFQNIVSMEESDTNKLLCDASAMREM